VSKYASSRMLTEQLELVVVSDNNKSSAFHSSSSCHRVCRVTIRQDFTSFLIINLDDEFQRCPVRNKSVMKMNPKSDGVSDYLD